jgi:hypothetical protein
MGLIFESALRVLVWLGDNEREESQLAISLLFEVGLRVDNKPNLVEFCTLDQGVRPEELPYLELEQWLVVARVLN